MRKSSAGESARAEVEILDKVRQARSRGQTAMSERTVVNMVIRHQLKNPKSSPVFEEYLTNQGGRILSQFKGNISTEIIFKDLIRGLFVTVVRFDSYQNLELWITSEERKSMIAYVKELTSEVDVQINEGPSVVLDQATLGLSAKNTQPDTRGPPKWKQSLLLYFVLFGLGNLVQMAIGAPLRKAKLPLSISVLINIMVMVTLIAYLVLPFITLLFFRWLMAPRPVWPRSSCMFVVDEGCPVFIPPPNDSLVVERALSSRVASLEKQLKHVMMQVRIDRAGGADRSLFKEEFDRVDAINEWVIEQTSKQLEESKPSDASKVGQPLSYKLVRSLHVSVSQEWERMIQEMTAFQQATFSDYIGTELIKPSEYDQDGNGIFTVIVRYKSQDALMQYLRSEKRKEIMVKYSNVNDGAPVAINARSELVAVFDSILLDAVAAQRRGSADTNLRPFVWKSWLVIVLAIWPPVYIQLKHFVPILVRAKLHPLLISVITGAINTIGIGWVTAPMVGFILQDWLLHNPVSAVPRWEPFRSLYLGFPCFRPPSLKK